MSTPTVDEDLVRAVALCVATAQNVPFVGAKQRSLATALARAGVRRTGTPATPEGIARMTEAVRAAQGAQAVGHRHRKIASALDADGFGLPD